MHQLHQVVCVCLVLKSIFPAVWTRRSRNSRIYASTSSGCLRLSGTEEHFSRGLDKALSKFSDICINFFSLFAFFWYLGAFLTRFGLCSGIVQGYLLALRLFFKLDK